MKYKCVVSDLDRTILRRNGTISSKTEEVLNKLVDDHVFFYSGERQSNHFVSGMHSEDKGRTVCNYIKWRGNL